MLRCILSAFAVCAVAQISPGQSMNLDYGAGAGTPLSTYAAAGLPGVWNSLTADPNTPESLVNVVGSPTTATITRDYGVLTANTAAPPTGDDERLLDDGFGGIGDVALNIILNGLRNGVYEVIVYGFSPLPGNQTTLVFLQNDLGQSEVIGGRWPGQLQEPLTHGVFQDVAVSNSTLTIQVVGGMWGQSGFINGLQLRRLTYADLTNDGVVNMDDLLTVVNNWGNSCPPLCELSCAGDVNHNCSVDIDDLLAVINDWG